MPAISQPLHPFRREEKAEKVEYRADPATCNACPVKAPCTSSDSGRQVHRSFYADYVERVKGYHQTFAYQKAMNQRKVWIEPLKASAKDWHGMRRFRLRRLWRVNGEASVPATGQNLTRLRAETRVGTASLSRRGSGDGASCQLGARRIRKTRQTEKLPTQRCCGILGRSRGFQGVF